MNVSKKCVDLVKKFEGISTKAHLCPANVWTIGYGSTVYPDGQKIKEGQVISMERAEELLQWELNSKAKGVVPLLGGTALSQPQFDAIVSFAYNCGLGNLKASTLLKKVKKNPNDPTIRDEFAKWNKARNHKGALVVLNGLSKRRTAEADLYYSS